MKRVTITLACTLALLVSNGCDRQPDNALVQYKGGVLTSEDLRAHYEGLKRKSQFRSKPELLTPEFVFDHALNMEMIIAKGLAEGLHHDPRVRAILHEQMSDLFLKIMEEKLITPVDRNSITEEEMLTFYEQHKDQYQEKSRYTLSAFSVDPNKATEAANAIQKGQLDFATAAASYALDKEERKNGGKTGTRPLRRFQPAWQPVVEQLELGVVSGPIQLDGKAWIMRLEGKTPPHQYSFEEKRPYIRNDVLYARYRDQWQSVYDGLKKQFNVRIDQKLLDDFYQQAKSPEQQVHPPIQSEETKKTAQVNQGGTP
ncbi:peptidyl-prolyl cis-trans isomerase [Desulfobulbus rhabdoformis]|uniref:peptidylprolyl isomerase n=1 Tax=Desulfobulbus rhabdoformis TaxID=34032 RepID=UPI0019623C77|nr:peptidylprolyl isomerase [Desulfobulbus rhabdoformis]MBM9612849.1 peptidyl-prolyl cis-trans isomerase [Desulfobulbus rhabdoformis]